MLRLRWLVISGCAASVVFASGIERIGITGRKDSSHLAGTEQLWTEFPGEDPKTGKMITTLPYDFQYTSAFDLADFSAWCEGAHGYGIGEWLEFDVEQQAFGVTIANGFWKDIDLAVVGAPGSTWHRYSRVRALEFVSPSGKRRLLQLADEPNQMIRDFPLEKGRWRVYVRDVYPGDEGEVTCLGGIGVVLVRTVPARRSSADGGGR